MKTSKTDRIAELLRRIDHLCTTGFALAIHIRYARPTLLYETYSRAWSDYYSENGLMLSDPVVHWGLRESGLLVWAEYDGLDEADVLGAAERFGLRNGMTYSVGDIASRTISGLTSATPFTPAQTEELIAAIDEIHALSDEGELSEAELGTLRALRLPRHD